MEFGKLIELGRLQQGMTQEELSKKVSINAASICRMEHGTVPRSREVVKRLAKVIAPQNQDELLNAWEKAKMGVGPNDDSRPSIAKTLAIISLGVSMPYIAELVQELVQQAKKNNYIIYFDEEPTGNGQVDAIEKLCVEQADGIILTSSRMTDEQCYRALLHTSEYKIPLVLFNKSFEVAPNSRMTRVISTFSNFGVVRADLRDSYKKGLDLLLVKGGCSELWYLGGTMLSDSEKERIKVIQSEVQTLKDKGKIQSDIKITISPPIPLNEGSGMEELSFLKFWLDDWKQRRSNSDKLGIIAYSDELALHVWNESEAKQLRVPDEVAIIGGYRIERMSSITRSLTSIRIPTDSMAQKAMAMIIRLEEALKGSPLRRESREEVVDCYLEVGSSTEAFSAITT